MNPAIFLAYLDEPTKTMIITKLKAMGLKPERLMSDSAAFFKAVEKALGRHNFEMLLKIVESMDGAVKRLVQALDDPAQFIALAGEVPDEIVERLGGGGTFQANKGLGCPEALAKASALAKALLKYVPEEGQRLAILEEKLWELATQQCTVLAALAKQTYNVEEF
ncbi:MAG: hypothetical protein QXP98_08855 [Thermoproteus sp.]